MKNITKIIISILLWIHCSLASETKIITHNINESYINIDSIIEKINNKKILSLSKEETIEMLYQLNEFDLGRFLLSNRGLNGYWISYLILRGVKNKHAHPLEKWLIQRAPTVLATRERFYIFQDRTKQIVESKSKSHQINIASIPCGLLDDLLTIDFNTKNKINITGIDLDSNSLSMAKINAENYNKSHKIQIMKGDAWNLKFEETFDIILSNGLSIYEKNPDRLVNLYKEFHKSLKADGRLITSFITPPPTYSKESPWINVDQEDLKKQISIFGDILSVKWREYRTEQETRDLLEKAGFEIDEIIYDSQHIFPTVIVKKSGVKTKS